MDEFKNPWAKPLWQRNAEDNMSLRKEIEKNYDAFATPPKSSTYLSSNSQTPFQTKRSNNNMFSSSVSGFENPWKQEAFQTNKIKPLNSSTPQTETSLFGTYTQNSKPQALSGNGFENSELTENQINPFIQVMGAIYDMEKNYFDMKKDRTKKADDYFHCKANFDAARRGDYGYKTAKWLGDKKEDFDYYYNQIRKGLSPENALKDQIHDKTINQIGRQLAKNKLYSTSKEACQPYRVRGINEKY